jgi:hypothetical protein
LADLATAASLLRRENMLLRARSVEKVAAKLGAHLKGPIESRIEPDLEALTETGDWQCVRVHDQSWILRSSPLCAALSSARKKCEFTISIEDQVNALAAS